MKTEITSPRALSRQLLGAALILSLGACSLLGCGGSGESNASTTISTATTSTTTTDSGSSTAAASYTNLAYAGSSAAQKLDLHVPAGTGPFPLVINIHGGAFMMGDKGMLDTPVKDALLAAGYAVATINYRLSGEAIFPAAVLDAKAAVRFLRASATTYRLDPARFAAFGQSAGGNLASMLGTTGDQAEFDDASLGNASVSSRVQAVIDWFGPTDFLQMDRQAASQGCGTSDQTHDLASSPESRYLGAAIQTVPGLAARANPISYISADDPPFLLQKGALDCTVPYGQSGLLADALRAAGRSVRFDTLAGTGHGGSAFTSTANIQVLLDFLGTALK
ncbi:alpha/beta hydrolase [Niveibacterium sp. 24ML]|uniref:alpha/beta hydrolase n=1 Tax=Niveibacterium sp. 24ML TaxID=2985512 RepID=UPI00226E5B16|nr:alpha/beta hydrolase [Niveibacterium sp. 24ML]MCX9157874.1 alpha/beta hydrolase [Niveibacterium sp. 24ML]